MISRIRWLPQGSTSVPRQGAAMAVLDGKPTIFGGFHDYDKYPTMVEQFDIDSGNAIFINKYSLDWPVLLSGYWFPLRSKLSRGRRYFGMAAVPETLFPQCA